MQPCHSSTSSVAKSVETRLAFGLVAGLGKTHDRYAGVRDGFEPADA
jgi:hypothetical protein